MIFYWIINPQRIDIQYIHVHVYLNILITRGSWSRKTSLTMATWNTQEVTAS